MINCFNVPTSRDIWDNAIKPVWFYKPSPTTWVYKLLMTDREKLDNPNFEADGGYLRVNNIKDEWLKAYESASPIELDQARELPNFDYDVFEEITGLDLRVKSDIDCEDLTILIDGVEYQLVRKET